MFKKLSLLFIAISLFVSACEKKEQKKTENIKAVKLLQITTETNSKQREISGVIESAKNSEISFRVSGQVQVIKVKEGDQINQGDVIAILKQDEFESTYNSAKANYESAKAALNAATQDIKRQRNLYQKKLISTAEIENSEKDYASAQSNEEVAKENLRSAKENLADSTLIAPYDGTVATVNIEPFTEISTGKPVITLQDTSNFEMHLLIPETLINTIKIGDNAMVNISSLENTQIAGKISEISTKNTDGNAYPIVITLAENDAQLVTGMTALAYLNYGASTENPVFLIPTTAVDLRYISKDVGKPSSKAPVYIYHPNEEQNNQGKLELREITISDLRTNMLEVKEGLKEGEFVVVAGVNYLADGQIVKPWQQKYIRPANEDL